MWLNEFGTSDKQYSINTGQVAELLYDLFTGNNMEILNHINDIILNSLYDDMTGKELEIYLTLSSLYIFSYVRVCASNDIKIDRNCRVSISHLLSTILVARYISFNEKTDVDILNKYMDQQANLIETYMRIWNENINNEPSPHYYVAKQACSNLDTKNNISMNLHFVEFLSSCAIQLISLLKRIQEEYEIIEFR